MSLKKKKCKKCQEIFTPFKLIQPYCSIKCEREQKKIRKEKKLLIDSGINLKKEGEYGLKFIEEIKIKSISNISEKRKEQLKKYRELRNSYMKQNKICEVDGCERLSEDLHHKNGRVGEMVYNVVYFMAICRKHHIEVHNNPKWARDNNYLI